MSLSLWTKFTQKRYFQSKTQQAVQGLQLYAFCVINVKTLIQLLFLNSLKVSKIHYFEHFERKICYVLPSGHFLS